MPDGLEFLGNILSKGALIAKNKYNFKKALNTEITQDRIGDFIGRGANRKVYVDKSNKNKVLKINQIRMGDFVGAGLGDKGKLFKINQDMRGDPFLSKVASDKETLSNIVKEELEAFNSVPYTEPLTFVGYKKVSNNFMSPVYSQKRVYDIGKHTFDSKEFERFKNALDYGMKIKGYTPNHDLEIDKVLGYISPPGKKYNVSDLHSNNISISTGKIIDAN